MFPEGHSICSIQLSGDSDEVDFLVTLVGIMIVFDGVRPRGQWAEQRSPWSEGFGPTRLRKRSIDDADDNDDNDNDDDGDG